jgi:ferrochelatase
VLSFFTSAYSSYSGCRQYRENLASALAEVGGGLTIERLGPYFNHPGFVEPFIDATSDAVRGLDDAARAGARLVFTTHSIPEAMADSSGAGSGMAGGAYVHQHRAVAQWVSAAVAERTGGPLEWDLVYQSRSGPPHVPWLEPDIDEHLRDLAASGCTAAVVVPIGFVSDHMEVLWDLDTQARTTAAEVGLPMVRVPTPGTDPRTVAMVAALVRERLDGVPPSDRPRMGGSPASPDRCAPGCCPNLRGSPPAVAGSDPVTVA